MPKLGHLVAVATWSLKLTEHDANATTLGVFFHRLLYHQLRAISKPNSTLCFVPSMEGLKVTCPGRSDKRRVSFQSSLGRER